MTIRTTSQFGPPPTERAMVWILFALIAAVYVVSSLFGAEPDPRPMLWIYTEPRICAPCRRLEKDIETGKLPGFQFKRLPVPEGKDMPTIYYRAHGKWAPPHVGWAVGAAPGFIEEWKAAQRKD